MGKHTPGPWREDDGNVFCGPLADARTEAITAKLTGKPYDKNAINFDAFVCTTEQRHEESDADARLISAAPDLLEACKEVMHCTSMAADDYGNAYDIPQDVEKRLLAAICKAEGNE